MKFERIVDGDLNVAQTEMNSIDIRFFEYYAVLSPNAKAAIASVRKHHKFLLHVSRADLHAVFGRNDRQFEECDLHAPQT